MYQQQEYIVKRSNVVLRVCRLWNYPKDRSLWLKRGYLDGTARRHAGWIPRGERQV